MSALYLPGKIQIARQNKTSKLNYHAVVPCSLSAPEGLGKTETGEMWSLDPTRLVTVINALALKNVDLSEEDQQVQRIQNYIFGLIQRRVTHPLKPCTSLAHDARAVSMVRKSSCCKEEQHLQKQMSIQEISSVSQSLEGNSPQTVDHKHYLETGFIEDYPATFHYHFQKTIHHQPEHPRLRQASMINASLRAPRAHPDYSNNEPDSPKDFLYPCPSPLSKPQPPQPSPLLDEQLVNAEYIPAQPCRASSRAYANSHSRPQKGSGIPKPNQSTLERGHYYSEEQPPASQIQPSKSRGGSKKYRSNEDRGANRKQVKKACRSQSENSLQRLPERKYNTVERDGGAGGSNGRGSRSSQSKNKKQQGSGSCRRWQSSLELSQDEADQSSMQETKQCSSNQKYHCGRRTRRCRPTHASYAYPHQNSHHHQHMEYQLARAQVPLCQPSEDYPQAYRDESQSSMSEADSPDTSSLSSDSDDSGGLVWPQQLPPQLSLLSPAASPGAPMQPKAFVKIKASHALKKKILRFRTGPLKVMTTV